MSALPIFDESRGEFVERHAETKPSAKPDARRAPAVCESRAAPKARAAHGVARMPSDPTERLAFLRAYLERMQRRFDDSGKFVDAEIVGELLAVLGGRQAVRAPRRQSDQSAIHAVCAAYVTALAETSVDEAIAAQLLARKLVVHGYSLPSQGGDIRGWKRLLWWRDQLERGQQPTDVRDIYKRALRFARQAPTEIDLQAAHEYALAENC